MARMCVVPRFRIREGYFEAVRRRVCQQRDDCLKIEPDCHHFDVLVTPDRRNEVLLYEIYEDAEAIATHRTYPHYLSFKADTQDMVESVELQTWTLKED